MFGIYFFLIINFLIKLIFLLVGVAYLTLLERKVLGYIHFRKGPNILGFLGILQPFSDGLKLFSKESLVLLMYNKYIYYFMPILNLSFSMIIWLSIPHLSMFLIFKYSFLIIGCCLSFGVYSVILSGWSSNSNYALLGSLRSVAQTISYELSLIIILISFLILVNNMSYFFEGLYFIHNYFSLMFICFPMFIIWMISCLAETNRSPFDFAEGESELVSGFNVEYGSGGFSLIFMSEYLSILFLSFLTCLLFFSVNMYNMFFFIFVGFISFFWIWIRGTVPRYRYDKLMMLCWKMLIPIALILISYYLSIKIIVYIL